MTCLGSQGTRAATALNSKPLVLHEAPWTPSTTQFQMLPSERKERERPAVSGLGQDQRLIFCLAVPSLFPSSVTVCTYLIPL